MAERKKVDPRVEARVLLQSARRCCLCFHLRKDLDEKLGQIAHLDQNPANGHEDNLAYLCMDHHSLYDSCTSQHKNYTATEIKDARAKLYQEIADRNPTEWWLVLDGKFSTFDQERVNALLEHLRTILEDSHITLKRVDSGSILLLFESSRATYERIRRLVRNDDFLTILDYRVLQVIPARVNRQLVSGTPSSAYDEGEDSIRSISRYSVGIQVTGPVQEFISELWRDLHLMTHNTPVWMTVLAPRRFVKAQEDDLFHTLQWVCRNHEPFEIRLGNVDTFYPVSPTVYLRIQEGGVRLVELNRDLNDGSFFAREMLPYFPSVLIARAEREEQTLALVSAIRQRWDEFQFPRTLLVEYLTLVRENEQSQWTTVGDDVPLGGQLIPNRRRSGKRIAIVE